MTTTGSTGPSVTKKQAKGYWTSLFEDHTDEVLEGAFRQIGTILYVVERWNFGAKVLDIQTGLGAVPHLLHDNGYTGVVGTDNDPAAAVYWENPDAALIVSPLELPFKDNSFDLVTWFSMHDGRVEEADWDEVIQEMYRVAKRDIVVKPYTEFDVEKDRDFKGWMLGKRFKCVNLVPILWFYNFVKD